MSDVILWLVIGLIVGGGASFIVSGKAPSGALDATIIGILGGSFSGWTLDALAVAVVGSVVLQVMPSSHRTSRI
jgi:uncharacterized membrane protein YeaQ/YmgE (transglycosylase-associated protein family)